MKICPFWGREFVSLCQKYEKEYGNFPFSNDIILNQNYIVIFISLSLVKICQNYIGCINVFLNSQCIVSQEKFQQKSWTSQPSSPFLSLHRSSRLEVLRKNICSVNFGKLSRKHPWRVPVLRNLQGPQLY